MRRNHYAKHNSGWFQTFVMRGTTKWWSPYDIDMPPTIFEGAIHIILEGMDMNEIERREVKRQVETIRKRLAAI